MTETEHPSDQDAGGDAAQAFEALRAEVGSIGRDIGALHTALIEHRGPDLTPTLGEIAKAQQLVAKKLHAIEQHPAIRMTADQHQQTIMNAGTALVQDATRRVQEASWSVAGEAKRLEATIGAARTKRRQLEVLALTAVAAFLLGIVLCPFAARGLPFGLDETIAAFVLHADRWDGGARLMASANPEAWREQRASVDLFRVNQAALTQCREAAAKTRKAQHCTVTILEPE